MYFTRTEYMSSVVLSGGRRCKVIKLLEDFLKHRKCKVIKLEDFLKPTRCKVIKLDTC